MELSQPKTSFKRFELPVQRFSKTALPLYLDLLKKHEQNIVKFRCSKEWEKVRRETLNAQRTVSQFRAAIREVDDVRHLLTLEEEKEFQRQIKPHQSKALDAIKKFTDNCSNTTSIEEITPEPVRPESGLRLQYKEEFLLEEIEVEQRKAQLQTYENLQQDISDLQEIFSTFSENVHEQAETVDQIEENVETALENVNEGERFLSRAAKVKATLYPLTGALIGTCIAGPVGLLAGIKIGSLAALGGTVLGFTGGQVVKKWQQGSQDLPQLTQSQSSTDLQSKQPSTPTLTTSASIL